MSQPNANEHAVLLAASPTRTARRPSRSDRPPIEDEATSPMTWNDAETYALSSTARTDPAPLTTKAAARNAGTHAHMPSSSQEWKVYPATRRMARGFFSTALPKRDSGLRACTRFGVFRSARATIRAPTTGPHADAKKAAG